MIYEVITTHISQRMSQAQDFTTMPASALNIVWIKMVLTGIGEYAYKRPDDGVLVVPIGCLNNWILKKNQQFQQKIIVIR